MKVILLENNNEQTEKAIISSNIENYCLI